MPQSAPRNAASHAKAITKNEKNEKNRYKGDLAHKIYQKAFSVKV